jgi:selenocysteine-specific translation elongation factor
MGRSVTVALTGMRDIAKELGKKGTASDLTLFNAVSEGHAVTLVEPTQFPEKLAPLLYALAMADRILLVVPGLTREVAETAATIDLFDAPVEILLGGAVGEGEVRKAFKGTRLESAPAHPLDLPKVRAEMEEWVSPPRPGPVAVQIDHAFPVKGVGAVALGLVRRGTLNTHEKLRVYPTEKVAEIRSIQVHDVDVHSAEAGERVGVALKGLDADELERGQVLAAEGSFPVGPTVAARLAKRCPYYRGKLVPGAQLHLLNGLQFVPAAVVAVDGESLQLEADRPVAIDPECPTLLADLSAAPGPRVVGRLAIPRKA